VGVIKTEAIILKRKPIFESDLLVTIISPAVGKTNVLFRSGQRPKTRQVGAVDIGSHIACELTSGRQLTYLTHVQLKSNFPNIRLSFNKLSMMGHFFDIIIKSMSDAQINIELFNLLCEALKSLDQSQNLQSSQLQFYASYLKFEGLHDSQSVSVASFRQQFENYTHKPFVHPLLIEE